MIPAVALTITTLTTAMPITPGASQQGRARGLDAEGHALVLPAPPYERARNDLFSPDPALTAFDLTRPWPQPQRTARDPAPPSRAMSPDQQRAMAVINSIAVPAPAAAAVCLGALSWIASRRARLSAR